MFNIKLLYFITQDKIIYLYEYIIKYNKRKKNIPNYIFKLDIAC